MFRKIKRISIGALSAIHNACFNPPLGWVLMLHRIGPKNPDCLECIEDLCISESWLQSYIDKNRNKYDFISVGDLYIRLNESHINRQKPFICITFDDGYKDNLTIGLPFFEKNCIPFSVFISTSFIERKPAFNFPFVLERIIRANDELIIDGTKYYCRTREEKNLVFLKFKELILHLPYDTFEESFYSLFAAYIKRDFFVDNLLDWDGVRRLAASPLCTIGSHTLTHFRLSSVPNHLLQREMKGSKEQIERMISQEVRFVSYPFGWTTDINEQTILCAKEAGYLMGFISHGGPIRKEDSDLFRIKRYMPIDHK